MGKDSSFSIESIESTGAGSDPKHPKLVFEYRGDRIRLERSRSEFAIKAPFWPWLGLKEVVAGRKRWHRVSDEIDGFSIKYFIEPWNITVRIAIYNCFSQFTIVGRLGSLLNPQKRSSIGSSQTYCRCSRRRAPTSSIPTNTRTSRTLP